MNGVLMVKNMLKHELSNQAKLGLISVFGLFSQESIWWNVMQNYQRNICKWLIIWWNIMCKIIQEIYANELIVWLSLLLNHLSDPNCISIFKANGIVLSFWYVCMCLSVSLRVCVCYHYLASMNDRTRSFVLTDCRTKPNQALWGPRCIFSCQGHLLHYTSALLHDVPEPLGSDGQRIHYHECLISGNQTEKKIYIHDLKNKGLISHLLPSMAGD